MGKIIHMAEPMEFPWTEKGLSPGIILLPWASPLYFHLKLPETYNP